MIQKLIDAYIGKSFAVLGSAPSVSRFKRLEDIVIGVNGAGKLLQPGDFFLSGDERSYARSWFLDLSPHIHCVIRTPAAVFSDRFYPVSSVSSSLMKSYQKIMEDHPEEFREVQGFKLPADIHSTLLNNYFLSMPEPSPGDYLIRTVGNSEEVSKGQKLNVGGTSSCMALQLAYIMGAREIHLYGIEFSNEVGPSAPYSGDKYFYQPAPGECGMTMVSQRLFMDNVISSIMAKDIPVFSHGPTKLHNTIKVE